MAHDETPSSTVQPDASGTTEGDCAAAKSETKGTSLWRHVGFIRLLFGSSVALVGGQFTTIAIPWLVLSLTDDPSVLGTVMAVAGLPPVIFMLLAGAMTDRYSPRRVLLVSAAVGCIVLAVFGSAALTNSANISMLYVFAFLMGVVGTFIIPARMAMLPRLVSSSQLRAANSMMMGSGQILSLVTPMLAGLLVATQKGLGIAFLIDAACYMIFALSIPRLMQKSVIDTPPQKEIFSSILESIRWLLSDKILRVLVGYWAMASLLAAGPIQVGLPLLVKLHLGLGSAAFGLLISASALGQLTGTLLSGMRHAKMIPLGISICMIDVIVGTAMMGLGISQMLAISAGLIFLAGIGMGFVQVGVFTWVQQYIPEHLFGRVISLLSLIMATVGPVSAAVTGVLIRYVDIQGLFTMFGIALASFALLAMTSKTIRGLSAEPLQDQEVPGQ